MADSLTDKIQGLSLEAPLEIYLKIVRHVENRQEQERSDEIDYLYHATTKKAKKNIVDTETLQCNAEPEPGANSFERIPLDNLEIKGVWFCATLFTYPDQSVTLPTISPYGEERISIPVAKIITEKHQMFFERAHYWDQKNIYIRFILVTDEQVEELKWCKKNLHLVDIRNNPIFSFSMDEGAKCVKNRFPKPLVSVENPHFWVEIMVVGDVPILSSSWDNVDPKDKAKTPAKKGLPSEFK